MKPNDQSIASIVRTLNQARSIVLTTHVNPDGDGLGSEAAIGYVLKRLKKKVAVINTSETPRQYQFLNDGKMFNTYDSAKHDQIIRSSDVILVLDISVSKRLDRMQQAVLESPAMKICIDHHLDNDGFAGHTWADPTAPATCEMMYDLIKNHFKSKIDYKIARALYTGMITDTGNFRFNSTRPETLIISSELLKTGVKPNDIYANVFEQGSLNTIKLLGLLLERMKRECGGGFHWTYLTQEDFRKTQTRPSDTEGYVDYTLKLENSRMGVFFYETADGFTKVSLRAKGNVNVQKFAKTYGGGGHFSASGIMIKKAFPPTMKKIVKELIDYFNDFYGKRSSA